MSVHTLKRTVSKQARALTPGVRCLATPSTSRSDFKQTLSEGPSLDDFIGDNVPERVVFGNTKA